MPRALWNDQVITETDEFETVEENIYFPPDSIDHTHFESSEHTSVCPWKGTTQYYHVVVNGERNDNAAWFYPEPKDAAANIKGHVAFWKGVAVEV